MDANTFCESENEKVGEIWVSSDSTSRGYFMKPSMTAKIFNQSLMYINGMQSEKRYLRTGDLGFIKERELFIVGRLKDLIIINGRNYYPQDIEFMVEKVNGIRSGCVAAFSIGIENDGVEKLCIVAEIHDSLLQSSKSGTVGRLMSSLKGKKAEVVCI